jgi:thioredoxin 1
MIEVNGINNLNKQIVLNKDSFIMLYFGATWCGPCNKLKLKLHDTNEIKSLQNLSIIYIDIDEEENKEIIDIYDVASLPTLIFIKLNEENEITILNTIIGYDWQGIIFSYEKIKKNCI